MGEGGDLRLALLFRLSCLDWRRGCPARIPKLLGSKQRFARLKKGQPPTSYSKLCEKLPTTPELDRISRGSPAILHLCFMLRRWQRGECLLFRVPMPLYQFSFLAGAHPRPWLTRFGQKKSTTGRTWNEGPTTQVATGSQLPATARSDDLQGQFRAAPVSLSALSKLPNI